MRTQLLPILLLFITHFTIFANSSDNPCDYDNVPPVMACDYHTVTTLGANGVSTVYAETFDDGSYDNCGIVTFQVRRMSQGWCPPGVNDGTYFGPSVSFCCEDVGMGYIWVVLKATDAHGNSNTCMVEVTVQDGGNQPHFECPDDVEISCSFWFSESDLWNPNSHTFGTIVPYGEYQHPIVINDPGNHYLNQPHTWGYDGVAGGGSGCNGGNWGTPWITITEVIDLRNSCGIGVIKRKFFVEYGQWTDWCYQTITVKDFSYNNYGITWPHDYHVDDCNPDLDQYDPDLLPAPYGNPIIGGSQGSCSLVAYAYEDLVFTFAPGACYKILREWTVIDWCKYNPNYPWSGGIWKHTQVIKITNHEAPVFVDSCPDIVVEGYESNCAGRFTKTYDVQDDCSADELLKYDYKIDLYSNGSYDLTGQGSGEPKVDRVLPLGWHKILVTSEDLCGNYSSCLHKVQVVDRKKPTPVCYHGLSTVVMPIGGMVTIWAKEFNVSSEDNCTPDHKLIYSFGPNGQDMSRVFTCDDVGTVPLQIYVTDEYNNTQYCSTFIRIDDNEGTCDGMNRIEGTVSTFDGIPVPAVEVDLYKIMPDQSLDSDQNTKLTNEIGSFTTGFGTTSYNRQLMANRTGEPMDGISTLDLVTLQRHILGIELLTTPEQFLAADVDGSGHVGVMDLLTLRNILLGAPIETANLGWYFFEEDCSWEQPQDILAGNCGGGYTIDQFSSFPLSVHFNAVKMGDINSDLTNSAWHIETRSSIQYGVIFEVLEEEGLIQVKVSENMQSLGMQFSLPTPNGDFELIDGVLSADANTIRTDSKGDILNLVWATQNLTSLKKGDVLFSIRMDEGNSWANAALKMNEGLAPEIYTDQKEAVDIHFNIFNPNAVNPIIEQIDTYNLTVSPNPFRDKTTFHLVSPSNTSGELKVYNEVGMLVVSQKLEISKGLNNINLKTADMNTVGLYYYQIILEDNLKRLTGKLIKS